MVYFTSTLFSISDYTFAPTLINILRPHPDVLQLHLFNFCTFLPVNIRSGEVYGLVSFLVSMSSLRSVLLLFPRKKRKKNMINGKGDGRGENIEKKRVINCVTE